MGINAFFVFSVCLGMGYSWQFALTAVFVEGVLFILLGKKGLRQISPTVWVLFAIFLLRYIQKSP